jgi:hypothetical protein
MNSTLCVVCAEPLPSWARADRRTCSTRCRVALWRTLGHTQEASLGLPACLPTEPPRPTPEGSQPLHTGRPSGASGRSRSSGIFRHSVAPKRGARVRV